MKKSRLTETQIHGILLECNKGRKAVDLVRENGVSQPTFYARRSKYAGMQSSQLNRLKELERELTQFKKMYAELAHRNLVLKDVIEKSFEASSKTGAGRLLPSVPIT